MKVFKTIIRLIIYLPFIIFMSALTLFITVIDRFFSWLDYDGGIYVETKEEERR